MVIFTQRKTNQSSVLICVLCDAALKEHWVDWGGSDLGVGVKRVEERAKLEIRNKEQLCVGWT